MAITDELRVSLVSYPVRLRSRRILADFHELGSHLRGALVPYPSHPPSLRTDLPKVPESGRLLPVYAWRLERWPMSILQNRNIGRRISAVIQPSRLRVQNDFVATGPSQNVCLRIMELILNSSESTTAHRELQMAKTKTIAAVLALLLVGIIALFAVLIIDGEAYDRWKNANELRIIYQSWLKDGSPEPPDVAKYFRPSASSTSFVYTASHVINGRSYQGLFAYRSVPRFGTYVITRSGEVVVVESSGSVRLLRIHKTRAAAW